MIQITSRQDDRDKLVPYNLTMIGCTYRDNTMVAKEKVMALRQIVDELGLATDGQGLHPITDRVQAWVAGQPISFGLLTLFLRHTSASLLVQENADPNVLRDLNDFFRRIVPEDRRLYRHQEEGPDDMPAHIRTALTGVQLAVPVAAGRLALGHWQGIYLYEHRSIGRNRRIALHLLGE